MSRDLHCLYEIYPAEPHATVPLGLRVNDLVYGRLSGLNAATGEGADTIEGQLEELGVQLRCLLERSGATQIERVWACVTDGVDAAELEARLRSLLGASNAGAHVTVACSELSGGELVRAGIIASASAVEACEGEDEGTGLPVRVSMGPVLLLPWVTPGASVAASDTETQLRDIFAQMDGLLESAGCTRDDVARVCVFLREVSDLPILNGVWSDWYPDEHDRPPHKYVPAVLPEGRRAAIRVIARPGAKRRVIELTTVRHGDPMSLGALHGELIVTSRVIPARGHFAGSTPTAGEYAAHVLGNARTVMEAGGAELSHLQQATVFIGHSEFRAAVEEQWASFVASGATNARLDIVEATLNRDGLPRIEIVAIV